MALLITKKDLHYIGIVCHDNSDNLFDLLLEYYNDEKIIDELFSLGEIVYLHSDIGKKHYCKEYQFDMDLIAKNNMWSTFKKRDHHQSSKIYKRQSLVDMIIETCQLEIFLFENLTWKHLKGI